MHKERGGKHETVKIDKNEISLKSLKRLSFILGGIGIILIFNMGVFRALGTIMILSTILRRLV